MELWGWGSWVIVVFEMSVDRLKSMNVLREFCGVLYLKVLSLQKLKWAYIQYSLSFYPSIIIIYATASLRRSLRFRWSPSSRTVQKGCAKQRVHSVFILKFKTMPCFITTSHSASRTSTVSCAEGKLFHFVSQAKGSAQPQWITEGEDGMSSAFAKETS